jgi:hypothetical protein
MRTEFSRPSLAESFGRVVLPERTSTTIDHTAVREKLLDIQDKIAKMKDTDLHLEIGAQETLKMLYREAVFQRLANEASVDMAKNFKQWFEQVRKTVVKAGDQYGELLKQRGSHTPSLMESDKEMELFELVARECVREVATPLD